VPTWCELNNLGVPTWRDYTSFSQELTNLGVPTWRELTNLGVPTRRDYTRLQQLSILKASLKKIIYS